MHTPQTSEPYSNIGVIIQSNIDNLVVGWKHFIEKKKNDYERLITRMWKMSAQISEIVNKYNCFIITTYI